MTLFACILCRKCLRARRRENQFSAMVRRNRGLGRGSAVQGDVAMMNVKLPGGREVRAPWSNLAPCGMRGAESDCRTSRRESKELLPSCFRGRSYACCQWLHHAPAVSVRVRGPRSEGALRAQQVHGPRSGQSCCTIRRDLQLVVESRGRARNLRAMWLEVPEPDEVCRMPSTDVLLEVVPETSLEAA